MGDWECRHAIHFYMDVPTAACQKPACLCLYGCSLYVCTYHQRMDVQACCLPLLESRRSILHGHQLMMIDGHRPSLINSKEKSKSQPACCMLHARHTAATAADEHSIIMEMEMNLLKTPKRREITTMDARCWSLDDRVDSNSSNSMLFF